MGGYAEDESETCGRSSFRTEEGSVKYEGASERCIGGGSRGGGGGTSGTSIFNSSQIWDTRLHVSWLASTPPLIGFFPSVTGISCAAGGHAITPLASGTLELDRHPLAGPLDEDSGSGGLNSDSDARELEDSCTGDMNVESSAAELRSESGTGKLDDF